MLALHPRGFHLLCHIYKPDFSGVSGGVAGYEFHS